MPPPDATITGFNYPTGIATDASGTLFVANRDAHAVDVFSNDQQGQPRLVRSLSTSFEPELITVTPNGYMIVTANNNYLAIYRSTARGDQKPLATQAPSGGQIYALASDVNNTIYVTVLYRVGIEAYPNLAPPPRRGVLHLAPARTIQSIFPDDFYYGLTVHNGRIFARLVTHHSAPGIQYAVYPSSGNGAIRPLRVFVGTACRPQYSGIAYGILVNDDLLYQACDTPHIGVYVYNSDASPTTPIGSVRGPFQSPDYLALAP
jgi:outer membrane protein assembly factor BamB